MFLTVTFTDKHNNERTQSINLAQIVSIGECEGKKYEDGFNSVLYSGNGHAFYSQLSPEEVVLAYQGYVARESEVRAHIQQALELKKQAEKEVALEESKAETTH